MGDQHLNRFLSIEDVYVCVCVCVCVCVYVCVCVCKCVTCDLDFFTIIWLVMTPQLDCWGLKGSG